MPDTADLDPAAAARREQEREPEPPRESARERSNRRAQRAAQLRVAGYSYEDIAKALGYSNQGGAWKAVERARNAALRESGAALISLELDRFDTLQRAAMTKAVQGDAKAINAALRVMEQRAKLLGLHEQRGQEQVADARDAFAVFLGAIKTKHPDPHPEQENADTEEHDAA